MINPKAVRLISVAIVFIFCAIGGIIGCTTNVGPIGEPAFEKTVQNSVDLGLESILQMGRVDWYPGVDAYTFGVPDDIRPGVLILQESRLFVLGWKTSEQKYEILLKIEYSNAKDVRRRVWGGSQRIVIELNDGETHAFTLMSDNGIGVSVPRINKAIAILRKKIPSSDAHLDQGS